jgi:photosystem II stability/assembly factor-like uncharacterized protein
MKISLPILAIEREPRIPERTRRVRYVCSVFILTAITLWDIAACSSVNKTSPTGTEHLVCSPDIQFVNHNVTCDKKVQGGWPYECQVSGSIVNNGTGHASGVVVWMEFGQVLEGVRSSTFHPVGGLGPGQKADFKNDFPYFELPTQYDIRIECAGYKSAQPSPVPSPRNSFSGHGPKDDVLTLAIDPMIPTTLYAGTQTQGVFKSMDSGSSWVPVNSGLVNVKIGALAIDPLLPTTIYAGTYGNDGTNGAAYKSVDGGKHWIEITNGMDGAYVFSLAIDPCTPATLYAGTSGGTFKSTNGGEVWQKLNTRIPEPYITHLIIDPLTPTNLYAVSSGASAQGLIKSINGGNDWSVIHTVFSDTNILDLVIDPLTPTTLYAATWSKGIFKSTDAGEHWTAVNTGLTDYAEVDALVIDPASPSTLYAAIRDSDIFKSTNGGESWIALDSNLGGVFIWGLALDPVKPTIIYAATESGVSILGE